MNIFCCPAPGGPTYSSYLRLTLHRAHSLTGLDRNLKAKRTRLFALNDDAPALRDNLMAAPFLRRLPPTKTTFVTTRRTASRVNVAIHSTYSETLLSTASHPTPLSCLRTHSNRRRGRSRGCAMAMVAMARSSCGETKKETLAWVVCG